jgi:hypothetical protein
MRFKGWAWAAAVYNRWLQRDMSERNWNVLAKRTAAGQKSTCYKAEGRWPEEAKEHVNRTWHGRRQLSNCGVAKRYPGQRLGVMA